MAVLRDDPYSSLSFLVVINGILDDGRSVRASFAEVSGLDVEVTPIEYRNGSEDNTVRKIPGSLSVSWARLKLGTTFTALILRARCQRWNSTTALSSRRTRQCCNILRHRHRQRVWRHWKAWRTGGYLKRSIS